MVQTLANWHRFGWPMAAGGLLLAAAGPLPLPPLPLLLPPPLLPVLLPLPLLLLILLQKHCASTDAGATVASRQM